MNLIHPKQLFEQMENDRKAKQNPPRLNEYFIKNPPVLIDYEYHIEYTEELRCMLQGIRHDFLILENVRVFIGAIFNREYITSEYAFDVRYRIGESRITFILSPNKKLYM